MHTAARRPVLSKAFHVIKFWDYKGILGASLNNVDVTLHTNYLHHVYDLEGLFIFPVRAYVDFPIYEFVPPN